jgi:hypothetical protein
MSENTADLPTVEESAESLTGFDEIAIQRQFGKEVGDLSATMSTRALVFVKALRENGSDATAAYHTAMGMSLKDVMGSFADRSPTDGLEVDGRGEA